MILKIEKGKSTLLRLLAGKRLTKDNIKVLGGNPFNSLNSQVYILN